MKIRFDCLFKKDVRNVFENALIKLCIENNLIPPLSESGETLHYKGIVEFRNIGDQKKFYGFVANMRNGGKAWIHDYSA